MDLQDILGDLWATIGNPLKMTLTKGECRRWNALARAYENTGFDPGYFSKCDTSCAAMQVTWQQLYPAIPLPVDACTGYTSSPTTTPTRSPTTAAPSSSPTRSPSSSPVAQPARRDLVGAGSSTFNFTRAAEALYVNKMGDIEEVMELLAKFHDWDEALLRGWFDSGIEAGLEILYDAIEIVRSRQHGLLVLSID